MMTFAMSKVTRLVKTAAVAQNLLLEPAGLRLFTLAPAKLKGEAQLKAFKMKLPLLKNTYSVALEEKNVEVVMEVEYEGKKMKNEQLGRLKWVGRGHGPQSFCSQLGNSGLPGFQSSTSVREPGSQKMHNIQPCSQSGDSGGPGSQSSTSESGGCFGFRGEIMYFYF